MCVSSVGLILLRDGVACDGAASLARRYGPVPHARLPPHAHAHTHTRTFTHTHARTHAQAHCRLERGRCRGECVRVSPLVRASPVASELHHLDQTLSFLDGEVLTAVLRLAFAPLPAAVSACSQRVARASSLPPRHNQAFAPGPVDGADGLYLEVLMSLVRAAPDSMITSDFVTVSERASRVGYCGHLSVVWGVVVSLLLSSLLSLGHGVCSYVRACVSYAVLPTAVCPASSFTPAPPPLYSPLMHSRRLPSPLLRRRLWTAFRSVSARSSASISYTCCMACTAAARPTRRAGPDTSACAWRPPCRLRFWR